MRTYDRLNAPYETFIKKMEEKSGVTWSQAEVALARQWLGPNDGKYAQKTVKLKSVEAHRGNPEDLGTTAPADANQPKSTDPDEKIEEVEVPPTAEEAADIIRQFESGAPRSDVKVSDTVSQHVQLDKTPLTAEDWWGTKEEERNSYVCFAWSSWNADRLFGFDFAYSYVSELVYIHSKVMIVDDTRVIVSLPS